jgi:hypothetical protein
MNKLTAAVIVCLFCLSNAGWATWSGTVTKDDVGVKDADVWTNPPDGQTTTQYGGGYSLSTAQGMEEGEYYIWIKAQKDGYAGYYYVEDTYYQAQHKTGLDIDLNIYVGTPP